MPEDATDIPSSFTQIGHIAHMNLRDYYFPWKKLIGQVILDVSRKKDDLCLVKSDWHFVMLFVHLEKQEYFYSGQQARQYWYNI